MQARGPRRLVIDATVARAAGGEDATYPRSKHCRDFLKATLKICHRLVMTSEISSEWKEHRSKFTSTWQRSMVARKKVDHIGSTTNDNLRIKIKRFALKEKDWEAMLKDLHLVEAAIVTDQAIISLNEAARELFAVASGRVGELKSIVWVNPEKTEEKPIAWLKNGAEAEKERFLGFELEKHS